jgi:hypothetical protein
MQVCNLTAAAALSDVPSGLGGGLSRLIRGRSNSPQFGTADAAFRAVIATAGPAALQIPSFASR